VLMMYVRLHLNEALLLFCYSSLLLTLECTGACWDAFSLLHIFNMQSYCCFDCVLTKFHFFKLLIMYLYLLLNVISFFTTYIPLLHYSI